jgi:PAS domain S-box-containing protein
MAAVPKDNRSLRRKAEKLLSEAPEKLAPTSATDVQKVVHELSVRQIELEIQDEELRRSREELEESRSVYADLYDFAPVGYLTFDQTGIVIRANLTACGLLGVERSLLLKRPLNLFLDPESQDPFYLHKQKVLETTTTQSCQLVVKRRDGTLFDAQLVSIVVQVNGQPAVRSILTDITERRAEEARRRYELLFQNSRDIVLLVRRSDGRILEANTAATSAYGYCRDELLNLSIDDLRVKGTGRMTADQLAQADAGGILFETIHRRKDGSTFPVEVSSQGATVAGTQVMISVIRDIAQRKQAEEALRKARDDLEKRVEERTAELQKAYDRLTEETEERQRVEAQLRQAQKMEALGTLAGGVAHDFNNMLAVIIGFSEIATETLPEDSEVHHQLQKILQAGMRGRDLVKQMLAFTRKTEQEKKPVLLSTIVKESVKLLRASLPQTISIKTRVKTESSLILADPVQIEQILVNLCTNAAHAMQEKGGTLDIELSGYSASPSSENPHGMRPGLYMKLTVKDTGTGISPDIRDRIFDPFFTTKKLGEGTGLGLSVVHGIVKQSSGYITVESGPDKGSTFTIYFPQVMGELKTDTVSDDVLPTGCERILFVDDEEALVEMGEGLLTKLGYNVTCRLNSGQALALFRLDPSKFDLVMTDQTMPEMTGVEFAKEILAIRADMPIVMCTGFSHQVDADAAKKAGIKAFAMKPLTKREIARTIRKVLDE